MRKQEAVVKVGHIRNDRRRKTVNLGSLIRLVRCAKLSDEEQVDATKGNILWTVEDILDKEPEGRTEQVLEVVEEMRSEMLAINQQRAI